MPEMKELADRILNESRDVVRELKAIKGCRGVLSQAPKIVGEVENVGRELGLAGPQKKELAIEIALTLCRPFLPWWLPEWLLLRLLDSAIEAGVKLLKR